MPGWPRTLSVPARLGQPDRGAQGSKRAGLAGGAHASDRARPEHAEFVVAARVVSLDGLSLLAEKGVELACSGGDRESLEVGDEDALERPSIRVKSVRAATSLTGFCQHSAGRELADRGCGDSLGGTQERVVSGGLVQLGEAGQDHALVVGPGDVGVVRAGTVEAVIDEVARVDQPAVVEPR